jgi:hypothetical protein
MACLRRGNLYYTSSKLKPYIKSGQDVVSDACYGASFSRNDPGNRITVNFLYDYCA